MLQIGRIGFLGGGRIAQAMAKGFIAAGLTKAESIIASAHPSDLLSLEAFKNLGATSVTENSAVVKNSDVIFLSVKPGIISKVLKEVQPLSDGKLFISVAMGVTLKELKNNTSPKSRIIRVMPNIPAIVQQACSVFVPDETATKDDINVTQTLLKAVGTCEEVDESLMDPITALAGSGPAYIFVLIEALADGGVKMGLPRNLAYKLASQTVLGSAQLVRDTNIHPGQLKDDVASPAGSTIAGLSYLEKTGFRHSVAGAIEAATMQCRKIASSS